MFRHCVYLVVISGANSAGAQSADDLVAKNIAARGGAAKLHSVQTMTMDGTISFGPDASSPLTVHVMRPDKIREDFNIDGRPSVRAYDGKIGWQDMPGGNGVEELSGGALENIRDEGENAIEGPLLDYAAKGNKVEYLGKDSVDGKPCFKLKTTLKGGTTIVQYLDAGSMLEIHEEIDRDVNGQRVTIIEDVGDYRDVDGVRLAHSFVSGTKDDPGRTKLSIAKFTLNQPIEATVFVKPTPGNQ